MKNNFKFTTLIIIYIKYIIQKYIKKNWNESLRLFLFKKKCFYAIKEIGKKEYKLKTIAELKLLKY
jgi:hypothetical protein